MPKLTIDNQPITVPEGATLLDAAAAAGVRVPTLCHLKGLPALTSCMVCVVRVNGGARLVPACATPAAEGMAVESDTPEVYAARRTALELLLGDHLGDCVGPCQLVCPSHMDIPAMLRAVAAGDLRAAIAVVKDRIPLPATLGRVCPELCERGCRRAQHDRPVAICRVKRHVGDADLASPHPYQPSQRPATGKRIVIVGGGPAGLSAAYYLQIWGHACTLLEAGDAPGGLLRRIESDRLPPDVLEAEIARIQALGVIIHTGERIADLAPLRAQFDAVLLTAGAGAAFGVEMGEKGIAIDRHTWQTSLPGVYACGGAVLPVRHAVRAVADGRAAARAIDAALTGAALPAHDRPFSTHMGRVSPEEMALLLRGADPGPRMEDDPAAEAARCLHCDCRKRDGCALRDASVAYDAHPTAWKGERQAFVQDLSHPAIIFEEGKCIACGRCVAIAEAAREALGLTYIGRGFTVRVAVPFGADAAAGLRDTAVACADACPTGALVRREEE